MTEPVKWFRHTMTGAPVVGSATGTLTSILDACLINGFNTQPVDTLTYDGSTGKCTATVGAGHGFEDDQVVRIEGAVDSAYNGDHRVVVIDPTTFSYVPDSAPAATNAAGTVTAKAAPVGGWEIQHTAVDKRVYRSIDLVATGFPLRVDDSIGSDGAQVTAYLSMSDVDTGTDQWGDGWWRKADGTRTMDEWALVGDSRAFYLMIGGGSARCVFFFGDFDSFLVADGYNCAMTFDTAASGGTMNAAGCVSDYGATSGRVMTKDVLYARFGEPFRTEGITRQGLYPDPVTGGVAAIAGIPIYESASTAWRGAMPGARQLLSPAHQKIHEFNLCLQGKQYLAISLEAWR